MIHVFLGVVSVGYWCLVKSLSLILILDPVLVGLFIFDVVLIVIFLLDVIICDFVLLFRIVWLDSLQFDI